MSSGAKGHAAKLLASWGQPPQTPVVLGRGAMMVRAAARAPVISGLGEGVALRVGELGVALETLVVAVVAPQPTSAMTPNNEKRTPRTFMVSPLAP